MKKDNFKGSVTIEELPEENTPDKDRFQPIKGKPTFDIDNLDNTFTQSKVDTVETSEGSWVFDLRN